MQYYFIACQHGKEEKTKEHLTQFFRREVGEEVVSIVIPLRRMIDRRRGKKFNSDHLLLPGYLLLSSAEDLSPYIHGIRGLCDCYGFLRYADRSINLKGDDRNFATWILQHHGVIGPSKAVYTKGEDIRIIDGPMKDFIGEIVKVDKRRSRIVVEITVGQEVKRVSMPIEFVEHE